VTKRLSIILSAGVLAAALVSSASAATPRTPYDHLLHQSPGAFYQQHGYLPINGVESFYRAKIQAANWAAQHGGAQSAPSRPQVPNPTIGANWQGVSDSTVTPPDANGAIGPSSYVEIVNVSMGIYNRSGGTISTGSLAQLTGDTGFIGDPMVLWDPHTQRFYYSMFSFDNFSFANGGVRWGFSKSSNPTAVNTSQWCTYFDTFGYPSGSIPDYPKLGQSKGFLFVGINWYQNINQLHANQSDVVWMSKPQGAGTITTCPAQSSFKGGKFANLRQQNGDQAWTPVPVIQSDPNDKTVIVTMEDIECPDICGNGTRITLHVARPNPSDPTMAQLLSPHDVTVSSFTSPPDAPQKSSANLLDTLDGRPTHAVAGLDPRFGAGAVWVSHTVQGGAGSEVRWYEIKPTPLNNPSILQSGTVNNPSLYAFNGGVSPDRTCTATQCAHGDSMVLGLTTSSSSTFATIYMVSKIGAGAQSAPVLIKASTVADANFGCSPCRWGDYAGATPDPAASLTAAHGEVWLTNQWTTGGNFFSSGDQTWNWEASP